jgi:preprotein translocase subunit SecD
MYVYPVDAKGDVGSKSILNPSHIASIDFHSTDPYTGFRMWRVVLTGAGALINATYTETHVRQKMAIFCDKQEVSRPMIAAKSMGTFIVIFPNSGL